MPGRPWICRLAVLVLLPGARVCAELSPAATNLLLPDAVRLALQENPELRGARARWEALRERPAQARALPDPVATIRGMDNAEAGRWPNTREKRFMIEQEFPGAGKRDLRERVARQDADVARQELNALARDLVLRVKESYFALYGAQRAAALARAEAATLQHLAQSAQALYSTGERSQQDVLSARTEQTLLRQRQLDLDAQCGVLTARLNTLLNRPAGTPLGEAATPPATNLADRVEGYLAAAEVNRPDARAAEARVARDDLAAQLAAREARPAYRLGVEYRRVSDGDDQVMLSVGFDLPIWNDKYRAAAREAERMRAASEAARESERRQGALAVQEAWLGWQAASRKLELYRNQLIPQAEARLSAADAGYRTGRNGFLDLLQGQQLLLDVRLQTAQAEGELGVQAARLERAVGVPLDAPAGDDQDVP